jgi:hypothetical protein
MSREAVQESLAMILAAILSAAMAMLVSSLKFGI